MMRRFWFAYYAACLVALSIVVLLVSLQRGRALNERDQARGQLHLLHVRCVVVEDGSATCPPGSVQVDRVRR